MVENLLIENEELDIDWLIMDSVNYPENNFMRKFPDLAKGIHPTKNHGVDFSRLAYNSEAVKIHWICLKNRDRGDDDDFDCECVHEFLTTPRTRIRYGCPFCGGKKVCLHKSIYYLFPELMREWHQTKNEHLDPKTISKGSGQVATWICNKKTDCGCVHVYCSEIKGRIRGRGCPYCDGKKICCTNISFGGMFPLLARE